MAKISFDKQHRFNYKDYIQSNSILILSDSTNLVEYEKNNHESFTIDFIHIEPNILINQVQLDTDVEVNIYVLIIGRLKL